MKKIKMICNKLNIDEEKLIVLSAIHELEDEEQVEYLLSKLEAHDEFVDKQSNKALIVFVSLITAIIVSFLAFSKAKLILISTIISVTLGLFLIVLICKGII